ncbi:MAG: NAD-dependent deacylase [Nitrospirae bacterium]|nr:NAD-dependent deacylase [Nitrospirota bacterium]
MREARRRIAAARAIAVLTGAGMSADSGVPTFRGATGLWRTHRAEELATPEAFSRDPRLVWEWYDWRRGLIAAARPNAGHDALAVLERFVEQRGGRFTLITQNVDGLHTEAGSRRPLELHGNIWMMRCTACHAVSTDRRVPLPLAPELPACARCGGLLRPHIVWFGESLDPTIIQSAVDAATACDLLLVIGTSGVVQPAASLASMAREAGAWVVEVNPERSAGPAVHCWLAGRAADIVPRLLPEALQAGRKGISEA